MKPSTAVIQVVQTLNIEPVRQAEIAELIETRLREDMLLKFILEISKAVLK